MNDNLLQRVKQNLIIDHHEDDDLIEWFITKAISWAEGYQHRCGGYYETHNMSDNTEIGVVMLASFWYESRDGSTGGFFADSTSAAAKAEQTINGLLRADREWEF